jgi:4-amino-4-deoxy-L-arabinose transferase-like glycosyltransferase
VTAVVAPDTEPPPARTAKSALRMWAPVVALGIAAVLLALWAKHTIYPAYSWNRDEPVYVWQAHALRDGQILTTDGGAPRFFQPWLTGIKDHQFFSQYTLGWPLVVLAGDVLFGSAAAAVAFGALLAVLGTYALAKELTRDRALALVAGLVMLASPIIPVQGGVVLGYLFTLGLGLFFATALLAGVRERRRWKLLVAGALLGWIFLTRPFDALLWGAAVVGYVAITRRREWRTLVRPAAWVAVGLLPLVVVTLAYNAYITGKFTQFPITAADPLDQFGFGRRRIARQYPINHYTLTTAIRSTGKNGLLVPVFLTGTYVGVLVAGLGAWLRRRDRTTALLLAIIVVFPAGYFFFWGMQVSAITAKLSGPIYLVPLYAPLSIFIAAVIVTVWRHRRPAGVALLLVLVVATVPFAWNRLGKNQDISQAQLPWKHATDGVAGRALVFVADSGPYLLFLDPFSENNADLDERVLYATTSETSDDLSLVAKYPDRTPYREQASFRGDELGPREAPNTPQVALMPLQVLRAPTVTFHVRVTNPQDVSVVTLRLDVDGRNTTRTLATNSKAGATYANDIVLRTSSLQTRGKVIVGVGYGETVAQANGNLAVRQLFPYRVRSGDVEMLLPGVKNVKALIGGHPKWRPTVSTTALDVEPRAATP